MSAREDSAERWDKSSLHDFGGIYGDYPMGKVSKVFPELRRNVLRGSDRDTLQRTFTFTKGLQRRVAPGICLRCQNPMLDRITHFLGRRSQFVATLLVVTLAVVLSVAFTWIVARFGMRDFNPAMLLIAAIVTVAVATPIVFHALHLIRELRESRGALKSLVNEVVYARDEAERANLFKTRFLANLSHELRTPLNSIIGFSSLLERQSYGPLGDARYLAFAQDIHLSGTHLLGLINDILSLSKIEAGAATPDDDQQVDVADAIDDCIRIVAPLAEYRGVNLEAAPASADGLALTMSDRMLRQILLNILSNGVKFTPSGGAVRIATELRAGGALAIVVRDTGIGMSPEDLKIALTPFGQVDHGQTEPREGTGLGLPLVKAMMELHAGNLLIDSSPNGGTTVSLLFPSARVIVSEARRRAQV